LFIRALRIFSGFRLYNFPALHLVIIVILLVSIPFVPVLMTVKSDLQSLVLQHYITARYAYPEPPVISEFSDAINYVVAGAVPLGFQIFFDITF